MARTGDSLYDIERRSTSSGYTVSQKYLHRVSKGDVQGWPKYARTFGAVAVGLQTTELAVVLGYAVELGIPVTMPVTASQLPAAVDEAPERLRAALLTMARAIADPGEAMVDRTPDRVPDVTGAPGMLEDGNGGEVREQR